MVIAFLVAFAHQSISAPIRARSTDGNGGLSPEGIGGIVIGAIGLLLSALAVSKGWECWKSRQVTSFYPLTRGCSVPTAHISGLARKLALSFG